MILNLKSIEKFPTTYVDIRNARLFMIMKAYRLKNAFYNVVKTSNYIFLPLLILVFLTNVIC